MIIFYKARPLIINIFVTLLITLFNNYNDNKWMYGIIKKLYKAKDMLQRKELFRGWTVPFTTWF